MTDEKKVGRHSVIIDRRENVSLSGILDVLSFDEDNIVCETELGMLMLKGSNLHVNKLNLDSGELSVDGEINSVAYENDILKNKGSLLSKLFK